MIILNVINSKVNQSKVMVLKEVKEDKEEEEPIFLMMQKKCCKS